MLLFLLFLNLIHLFLKIQFIYSSMTGEQVPAPSSPRDGDDVSITLGRPKVYASFLSIYAVSLHNFAPPLFVVVCFVLIENHNLKSQHKN